MDFAKEFEALWQQYFTMVAAKELNLVDTELHADFLNVVLRICFYWYNLMPLSRGTAAIGMIALHGLLLRGGLIVQEPIPAGMQPDWEAILTPRPEDFVQTMRSRWLDDASVRPVATNGAVRECPLVDRVIATPRDAIIFLTMHEFH